MELETYVTQIKAIDRKAMEVCEKRWDSIAKPLKSLGKIESNLIQIAGIQRTPAICLEKKALVVMCADNGVVEEGVTQTGQEVTAIVAENFLDEKSCAAIMSAMTREEAVRAVETGIQIVAKRKAQGYHIIATGEMGIGNTTTSSAVASVLLHQPVEQMTGRGAGLDSAGLKRKIEVIKKAIQLHQPDATDPIDVLSKVGGLDIAGLTGVYLGGAIYGIPVVADGFISSVAALTAIRIEPLVQDYVIASHVSKEPAGAMLLEAIGKSPSLTCDMCLGEGTGAVALFPLLDMGLHIYEKMSTFAQIDIEDYVPLE